jgi:hypothetical protein
MKKMFSLFQSLRVRVLTGTAVIAVGAFVVVANVDARSPVERAREWASTHHVALSSMTLEEYAAYPEDYRKAIIKEIAPEDQSRLWRTQLALVLKNERALTDVQRAFIARTMDQSTPESFVPGADHPEICADIATIFPDKRVRKELVTLGSAVNPVSTWRPFLIALTERVHGALVADASANYCNCRGLGLCECGLLEGCQDDPTCSQIPDLCGCIWLGQCDQRTCQSGIMGMATSTSSKTSKK